MDSDAVSAYTSIVGRVALHPTAFVAPTAALMGDVTLGPNASVWYHTVVRGDMAPIVIGADSNLQDGTIVHVDEGVPCTVGQRVAVGHRVILHGCTVGDDCLIGMGSVLLNGVMIGSGSVVAAGAVIPEGTVVPPCSLVMGIPGRIVRRVDAALAERVKATWTHYVEEARAHRSGRYPLLRP
jgi:carbonic anhydrase/acetyltransferase-like protein (isoleucine patch superfamily)